MPDVDRETIKTAMKDMIEKKEGLSKKGVPDVAVLETRLNLKGQIGAKLRNEIFAEIKPKAVSKEETKPAASKEEAGEAKTPSKAGPKKSSLLTIKDGKPVRVHFEDGKQVRVEKIKTD